jgi:hypothetical protein
MKNNTKDSLRLIANPNLLANEKKRQKVVRDTFHDKLGTLLKGEYSDIYLSDQTIEKIRKVIKNEINNLMIDRIVNECLESCIEEVINQNKFDFCLPFD